MIEVDKSKLELAKRILEAAHQQRPLSCPVCENRNTLVIKECSYCKGVGHTTDKEAHTRYSTDNYVDYWNARTLVAECEIDELKKQVEELKKKIPEPPKNTYTIKARRTVDDYECTLETVPTLEAAKGYCKLRGLLKEYVYLIYDHNGLVATIANGVIAFTTGEKPVMLNEEITPEKESKPIYLVRVWNSAKSQWVEGGYHQFSCLQQAKAYGEIARQDSDHTYWSYIYKDSTSHCVAYLANSDKWWDEGNV